MVMGCCAPAGSRGWLTGQAMRCLAKLVLEQTCFMPALMINCYPLSHSSSVKFVGLERTKGNLDTTHTDSLGSKPAKEKP